LAARRGKRHRHRTPLVRIVEVGLVKMGQVSSDGTEVRGNASKHKAMSCRTQGGGVLWREKFQP